MYFLHLIDILNDLILIDLSIYVFHLIYTCTMVIELKLQVIFPRFIIKLMLSKMLVIKLCLILFNEHGFNRNLQSCINPFFTYPLDIETLIDLDIYLCKFLRYSQHSTSFCTVITINSVGIYCLMIFAKFMVI